MAALAVLLAGGTVAAPVAAGAATATTADPARVVVTVADGHVRLPAVLRPGLHRFVVRVTGSTDGVQLVRPRAGYSLADYRADEKLMATGTTTRSRHRAAERIRLGTRMWGGTLADRGTTSVFWQRLPRGRVFVASQRLPWEAPMVTVTGTALQTTAPRLAGVASVTDGSLQLPADLPASGTLLVRNVGPADHQVGLARLADGKTVADVTAFFQAYAAQAGTAGGSTPEPASPFDESVYGAVTQLLGAGGSQYLQYRLPPGGYAALCPEVASGTFDLHLMHGELAPAALH